jgi:HTH-type transcriptional regulator / antitoxin HigA
MAGELKPIRTKADHKAALAEVGRLPDRIEAIKFRMEQQGLTRKDLEPIIGTRTRVAELLNRKRGLSIDMIRRLHNRLGISSEVLIRPSRVDAAA